MKTITINFPAKTAKQIVEECGNKLGKGKLLYDIGWYKNEVFYTTETCRAGERKINLELKGMGKTWDKCQDLLKGNEHMLNFAEVIYVVSQSKDFRKMIERDYTWTCSRTSDGLLVPAGYFDGDGGDVIRWRPGHSLSVLGCAFSQSEIESSPTESSKGDEAFSLEVRVKALEDWKDKTFKL